MHTNSSVPEMDTSVSIPQAINDTVSGTVSCCDAGDRNKVCDLYVDLTCRSLLTSVTRISKTLTSLRPGASASVMSIVSSLLATFIAKRQGRRFEGIEYGRFIQSFTKTIDNIQSYCSTNCREQDFVKYNLAVLLCQTVGDSQLPAKPDWITKPLFVGWLRRNVVRAVARRDISFINSLYQSKRAWPRLSIEREEEAIHDHQLAVCSKRGGPIPKDLFSTITETVGEVFSNLAEPTRFIPSGGACMQASRSKGGASCLFAPFNLKVPSSEGMGKGKNFVNSLNSWRQGTYTECLKNVKDRIKRGDPTLLDVKLETIPEPSKFRVITKGDGYLYTAIQPAQGQLLDSWKRHKSSTMLQDIDLAINQISENLKHRPDWKWVSVDYKSATDLLFREVSILALASIKNLHEQDVALYSMYKAFVHYPDGSVLRQEEGQLMGHPLSFPLLCVINLACYRTAIKRYYKLNRDSRLRRELWQNVLVNGDDMLFKAPEDFIKIFYEVTAEAGLKISLGKNYVSSHFALINSRWYQSVRGRMVRRGYLNLKLVKGESLKTGESSSTPELIGKDVSEMIDLCPWTKSAIPWAFSRWSSDFRGWFQPNWFLPVHLGGYGVSLRHAQIDWGITRSQRLIAKRMMSPELKTLALYKRSGMSIPSTKFAGLVANWHFIPAGSASDEQLLQSKSSDDWLVKIAYATRASQMRQTPTKDVVSLGRFDRKDLRTKSIKPMALMELAEYWNCIMYTDSLPSCPPFLGLRSEGTIKYAEKMFDREQRRRERNPYYYHFSGVLSDLRRVNMDMNELD